MQTILIYALSALSFLGKADIFLLPCPFKYLTGIDCPGCGFQRSVLALIHGRFSESWHLYPPAIPFLIGFASAFSTFIFKWDGNSKILRAIYFTIGAIVMLNYAYKLFTGHLH